MSPSRGVKFINPEPRFKQPIGFRNILFFLLVIAWWYIFIWGRTVCGCPIQALELLIGRRAAQRWGLGVKSPKIKTWNTGFANKRVSKNKIVSWQSLWNRTARVLEIPEGPVRGQLDGHLGEGVRTHLELLEAPFPELREVEDLRGDIAIQAARAFYSSTWTKN